MKRWLKIAIFPVVVLIVVLAWGVYFHNEWVTGHAPKFLHGVLAKMGQKVEVVVEPDEDPDNSMNEIPVHVAKISVGTVHHYIEGIGQVAPRPARAGEGGGSGSATIAAPVAGVVGKVACALNQKVKAGDVLVQLDERLAASAEQQATAAVAEAQAALAALKAQPRADQVALTQLAIDKAQAQVDLDQKNYDRMKQLLADQVTASKNVEQAAAELAGAKDDLLTAQKQMEVLKHTPLPEDVRQQEAKVQQAQAALETAKTQRAMLTVTAPIDGTVVMLAVNPGESVDTTRTLVQLVALDRLWVDVDVPVDELPGEVVGLPVQLAAKSGAKIDESAAMAKVTYVSSQVEPKNGAVLVGIDLPKDTALRPGQSVRVRIVAQEHKDVLVVPREAVVQDVNNDQVISIVEGDQARHQTVKIGLEENGMIEISGEKDKVKEGVQVVTVGAFGLRETQVTHVKVVE